MIFSNSYNLFCILVLLVGILLKRRDFSLYLVIYLVLTLTHGVLFYTAGYSSLSNLISIDTKIIPRFGQCVLSLCKLAPLSFNVSLLFSEHFFTFWCTRYSALMSYFSLLQPWNFSLLLGVLILLSQGMVFRNQDLSIKYAYFYWVVTAALLF